MMAAKAIEKESPARRVSQVRLSDEILHNWPDVVNFITLNDDRR